MAAGADAILAQLASQRLRWVPLDDAGSPGAAVQLDTPSAFAAARLAAALRAQDGDAAVAELAKLGRDWRGITGVTVLGAAVGSSDAVPWHPRVFALLAGDRPAWVSLLAGAAVDAALDAAKAAEAATGN